VTVARLVRASLWLVLAVLVAAVIVMTWHPWVVPWTGLRH
jgi:hypothetical protein